MNRIIFFPGKFRFDEPGAVSVITQNLFSGLSPELSGIILGMGFVSTNKNISNNFNQINLLPKYLSKSIVYRFVSKLFKNLSVNNNLLIKVNQWSDEQQIILADNLAAIELKNILQKKKDIKIAIGLNGDSLEFGRVAKAKGKHYLVHSQFCHPYTQNRLIEEAYNTLGIHAPKISQLRLERQLATIDLADKIWCPSEFVRQSFLDNGVSIKKTFVSHLGIDLNKFKISPKVKHDNKTYLILFVGNVSIQKGIHILLKSLSKMNILKVRVILNGRLDLVTQLLINKYKKIFKSKSITISVDPGDPRRYYKRASVVVLPSVHDAYGIVVLEAMAAGLPVIISDNVGARDIVEHKKNGLIFSSGDSDALKNCIEILLKNSNLRSKYGMYSKKLARKYNLKYTALSIKNILYKKF